MKKSGLLLFDAVVNLVLGILLLIFTPGLVEFLGVPESSTAFYPRILGGVLFGIGLALLLEYLGRPGGFMGLGGAIVINISGGAVLAAWLLFGGLALRSKGKSCCGRWSPSC